MASNRMRTYEQLEQRARRRRTYDQQSEDGQYLDRPERNLGANTMDAPDDLYTRRNLRRHRVVVPATAGGNGNPLVENVLILILLVASIYGLYRLTVYLLSQAS